MNEKSGREGSRLFIHLARTVSCLLFIICIIFVYVIIVSLRPAILPDIENRAVGGVLDLRNFQLDDPIEIIGQWERIPIECCENLLLNLEASEIVEVPMSFTSVTDHASAYRLLILPDAELTETYIFLSPIQGRYKVLFNNELVFMDGMESSAASIIPMLPVAAFRLDFDTSLEYQELVILICSTYEGADFFHSEFVLGSSDSIRIYIQKRFATWALITGLLIMLIVNRLIFMMICPENEIASLMTLIDAAIMFRILLGIPELYHVKFVLFDFSISNENIARVNFLPVLLIGIVTIHFIARIFNTQNQINKRWFQAITSMSCIVGIVFFINIHLMATNLGFAIYLLFFMPGSFLGGLVFLRYLRENRITLLQMLYVIMLAVIGFMIVYEMNTIRSANGNFLILVTGYFVLIFLHVFFSLWENNSKYKEYESLSHGFEEAARALRVRNIDLQNATQEQQRLEILLQTVNSAAAVLLAVENEDKFEEALMQSMEKIGHCLSSDRVQLWRVNLYDSGIFTTLVNQWLSELGEKYPQIELNKEIPYGTLPRWEEMFLGKKCFNGPTAELPPIERHFIDPHNALKSVVIIPIFLQEEFWGFFTIDDCVNERIFSDEEMDILRSASLMIASTVHRVEQTAAMQRIEVAEESNRAKSRFLARMSHEIRTPITAVMGISEIQLQNPDLSPNIEESFAKIHNSAKLLLGIINDILDLSKIEAGKMEIVCEEYELSSVISDVTNINLTSLDNKDVKFRIYVDETLPAYLIGDSLRIEQILNNLLSNAFKYTKYGTIEFSVECQKLEREDVILVFSIRDTGLGMSPEQVDILYNEYTRFHEQRSYSIGGTGLGMPIVSNLSKLMDAKIELESKVGVGTNVVVRIPQKTANTKILGKETALQLQQFENMFATAKRFNFVPEPMPYGHVLVVDDVDANLYVAQGLLAFYGLNIETCSNGYESIEKIKQGKIYDLIFMDHMMPGIDGTETMRTLRDMGYTAPIVALTANTMLGQAETFIKNGFDGFISKPIQTKQLNIILTKHIKDRQPPEVIQAAITTNSVIADVNTTKGNIVSTSIQENINTYLGSADLIKKLQLDFAKSQKNKLLEIRHTLSKGDTETAHLLSHSLKGLAGLIGEETLANAARDVEHILATGKTPDNNLLQALEIELKRVLNSISEATEFNNVDNINNSDILDNKNNKDDKSNHDINNKADFDSDKVTELFDKLCPLLKTSNAECLSLLDEVRIIPETSILVRQIEEFDFRAALKTIDALREKLEV